MKAAAFVESLSRMRADHEDNASLTSFLDYTRDWIATVNKGGLYEVNDDVYLLMKEIEATMQEELVYHLKSLEAPYCQKDQLRKKSLTWCCTAAMYNFIGTF